MSHPSPLVSVVMPVRDAGNFLLTAVNSILRQDYHNFELLIIDDHSRDDALTQLPTDARIRVLVNAGEGIVDALNTGVRRAEGEFIARMDADDISLPQRLTVQVDYLIRSPDIGIAGAQVELFSGQPITEGYLRYQRWINALTEPDDIEKNLFVESPIPHPSALMRKSVLAQLGGYRQTDWAEDYDLWLRAGLAGIGMGKPNGVLLRWRDHPSRLSRRDDRCDTRQFVAAKAWALARRQLCARKAVICGTGRQAVDMCDSLRHQQVDVCCFVDINPRRVGGTKRGVPVISIDQVSQLPADILMLGSSGRLECTR